VLDLATGTGALALAAVRHAPRIAAVVGLDLAGPMLERARTKAAGDARVTFAQGDARTLPFGDNAFSAVIIAWGIRNFHGHREETLDEIHRVLQPGGLLLILELGLPSVPWLRYAYRSYLRHLLPRLAGIAGADPAAYHYLSRSVEAFPEPDTVNRTIASHGFSTVPPRRLTLGAATLFEARRT
jgi:demethylmenaquinone methyltransferase/2-methoxy-6-polyprenyl-1,4-benzoquinol methylase